MAVPFVAQVKRERRMAGSVGFEPTHDGIKTRCLTTWLRPNKLSNNSFYILIYFLNFDKSWRPVKFYSIDISFTRTKNFQLFIIILLLYN